MASPSKPWADTPFQLIPSPVQSKPASEFTVPEFIAYEMACAHNGMLRALNSIYNQAPYVTSPRDIRDLLTYIKFWCDWIHEHHEGEETLFFPETERIIGIKGYMARNVEQHHAFLPGLEELKKIAEDGDVEGFDGQKLKGTIEGFGGKLSSHLTDEIETLLELKEYPEKGPELKKVYEEFDSGIRKNADMAILFPIVFGSSDSHYPNTRVWPEAPFFVRYLVHYWFERKYNGAWRFSPSTTWGEPRPLLFSSKSK